MEAADAAVTADAVLVCRTAVRQIARRLGYQATFMSRPQQAETASTGWHLHQSLIEIATQRPAFMPDAGDLRVGGGSEEGAERALADSGRPDILSRRAGLPGGDTAARARGHGVRRADGQRLQALPAELAGARPDRLGHRQQGGDGAGHWRSWRPIQPAGEPLR